MLAVGTPSAVQAAATAVKILLAGHAWKRVHEFSFRGSRLYRESGRHEDTRGKYDWYPVRRAGNFSRWTCFPELEHSPFFNEIRAWCETRIDLVPEREQISRSFDAGCAVGWASSVPIVRVTSGTLVRRRLNSEGAVAYFVSDKRFKAPLTNLVTVNALKKPDDSGDGWVVIINNIYPGPDIGSFRGNVSDASGLALFDRDHPGE